MQKAIGELSGNSIYGSNEKRDTSSRRGFVLGAVGLLAAGGGLIGTKLALGSNEAVDGEKDPTNNIVSAAEAEMSIDQLVLPDLYEDRPWADPEQLIGLSAEELKEIAAIPITAETSTDEGFNKIFEQKMELIANAGRTQYDFRKAREVGEKDQLGNNIGTYKDYVEKYYMNDMIEGLFTDKYTEPDPVVTAIKEYFSGYANEYSYVLTQEEWRDKATLYITTDNTQPEVDFPEPDLSYNRNMHIILMTRRPGVSIPGISENAIDIVDRVSIAVNANEGANSYNLAAQYVDFKRQ